LLLGLTKLDPSSKALFDRVARERAGEVDETGGQKREHESKNALATPANDPEGATLPPGAEETPIPVEAEEASPPDEPSEEADDSVNDAGATLPPEGAFEDPRHAALERLRGRKRSN
jgi:hypothetical protein